MRKPIALVVALAALLASAAHAAGGPAMTFKVSGYKVLYGHKLTLSGRLASGKPGQAVTIFSERFGAGALTKLAVVKTGANGSWSFKIKPSISTSYQARAGSTVSRQLTIGVRPAVTVSELGDGTIWAHIASGQSFAGRKVELQRHVSTGWTTIANGALSTRSTVTFPAPLSAGSEQLRIAMSVNQAGEGFLGASSHALLYRSQALTLRPAAFKVLYGKSLALSGRISNQQAGQVVSILAWEYGHSAPTKTTMVITRAGGFWNTTVKPTIQTSYQARWSGNETAKTTIGVRPAVTVTQLVSGRIATHVAAGHPLTGRTVQLQQLRPGSSWTTLTQLKLNRNSSVTFPAPIASGSATLRIALSVNQAGAGFLGTSSHPLAYHTKFVSIAIPATKVLFGKSLTLSGQISMQRAGERITILGWKYGHSSPTRIGTVVTRAGGHWSFSVKPTIQTSYLARWGGSDSAKLLVGVEPLATLNTLADGRIATHIEAGGVFTGRQVQLQQLRLGLGWRTIQKLPLNRQSSVVFPAPNVNGATLRIAMSVNEAGAGFLGTVSHAFVYHTV